MKSAALGIGLASVGFFILIGIVFAEEEEGFRSLFDGQTLQGWDGDPTYWRVEDGVITGESTPEKPLNRNTFIIWCGGQPADFILRLEYRILSPKANSGIQYRSYEKPEEWGRWVIGGYQADITDISAPYSGILYDEHGRGILAKRGQKVVVGDDHKPKVTETFGDEAALAKVINPNGWNHYEVIARGFHLQQKINGHLMVDVTDNDTTGRRSSGLIALQLHAGPPMKIQFRNIYLKELPAAEKGRQHNPAGKIAFVAGPPSHGYGEHEYLAGCRLLSGWLKEAVPSLKTVIYEGRWPADAGALDDAAAIVVFADGGENNIMLPHLDEIDRLMKRGVGLACLHYTLEMPKGKPGDLLKEWLGGYFETFWSVNPLWTAEFRHLPEHPAASGLKPFAIKDEWYFHMRFLEGPGGYTPLLSAVPPDAVRNQPDGIRSGNPTVRARKGMLEHVAWVCQRPDGGRGFGFTGGHWHWNWAHRGFRTVVLNGIAWTAKLDIPPGGIPSKTLTLEELASGLDKPPPADFDRQKIRHLLHQWQAAEEG